MSTKTVIKVIKRYMRALPIALLTILTVSSFQNCGGVHFYDARTLASLSSCTTQLQTTQKKLRIIFMIDNSGSTATTDPAQYYRSATIQEFIQDYGTKENFTYAFGLFSGTTSASFDIPTQIFKTNATQPIGNATNLGQALQKFSTMGATGNTPYTAAFTNLQNIILNDLNQTHEWEYVVVFMSDGKPSDVTVPVDNNLKLLVASLINQVEGQGSKISLSTVYFGPQSDTAAINNLQGMATEGKGQFVNTNMSDDLLIDDLITIPGQTCISGN